MIYCRNGCVLLGVHDSDCSDDECQGCVPRVAIEGTLCRRCASRLLTTLVDIPALVKHLRLVASAGLSSPAGKSGGGSMPPRSKVLYRAESDFLDQLGAVVGSWFININEIRGFPWGDEPRSWSGWLWHEAEPCGVPIPWSLSDDALIRVVEKLVPLYSWICKQDWAADFMVEVSALARRGWMRWPEIERAHRVPLPCPKCDAMSLEYRPPVFMTAPAVVSCDLDECGAQWTSGEWLEIVRAALSGAGVKV